MSKKDSSPEAVETAEVGQAIEHVETAKLVKYVFAKNGSADFGSFKVGDVATVTGEVLDQYLAAGIVKIG